MDDATYNRLMRNYMATAKPGKKGGKGGTATSLISEGGGLGGAALGATIGSIVPGIGTVIGGIIGGGLGAFGGRLAENKVRDDRWGVGDAATEGLVTGALSSVAPGLKALKGAGTAAKGLGAVDDVAKAAKATAGKNTLDRAGRSAYRATLGIDDIVSPGKTKPNTIAKADELVDEALRIGLKGTPAAMQRQVKVQYDELGKELGRVLPNITKTVPVKGKSGLFSTTFKDISDELPLTFEGAPAQREIQRVLNEIEGVASKGQISARGLQNFKDRLAGRLSNAFTKLQNGADLTPKEAVDMAFWRRVDDAIGTVAPEAKALTVRQSKLYGLAQGLGRMTRTPGNPTGLADIGIRAGAPAFRKGQNAAGRAMMAAGNIGANPAVQGAGGALLPTIGENMLNPVAPSGDPLEDALMASQDFGDPMQGMDMGMEMGMEQQDPYPRENLMYDIQRDPQNADKYIEYYQMMQEVFGQAAQKPLSAAQQQRVGVAQSGLDSIGLLEDTLATDPGAFSRQALPNPLGITARLTGTSDVRAATDNIIDVIARLRSGAAITEDEARRFGRQLPQAGDTAETAAWKIAKVRRDLESVVAMSGAGGDPLEDALMQRGGYY